MHTFLKVLFHLTLIVFTGGAWLIVMGVWYFVKKK